MPLKMFLVVNSWKNVFHVNCFYKNKIFTNSEDSEKCRNLARNMLEAQTEMQLKTAATNLESFTT